MTIRPFTTLCILVAVVTFAACDSDNPVSDLTGVYTANFVYTVNDVPYQESWSIELSESPNGEVTGAGFQGSEAVTVTGRHDHPEVVLDFVSEKDGFIGTFTGDMTDDGTILEGAYNFTVIFVNIPMMFRRMS